jgi:TPP-dependent pyruvate/acetoin dehydrogenase alpha subunit
MAAAEKQLGSGRIVCVFLGDGAMAEGSLYEAMNMAALWRLPILFAVEHNQYAQTTHWSQQHAGSLSARASAFGVQTTEVDGNDVEAVFAAASACAQRLRNGDGAQMLFLHTYRLGAHSKGDDLREAEELQQRWGEEPVLRLAGKLDAAWVSATQEQVASHVASIVADLKAAGAAP